MSRFHCEITNLSGQPLLRDLGSRNGTFVDGVPVHAGPLRDGAVLSLGRTRIRFEIGDKEVQIPLSEQPQFGLLVGQSVAMRAAFARLAHAAARDTTVLLSGETGTGKDLAAESIHTESQRKDGPFVVVDCGALPPNLLESVLFGHERGAFSGADRLRPGAFEEAQGGTIFLDEVGELGADLQPKLLRVLESREVQRIGSSRRIPVDVRIVAATSRNLRREVNAKRFRSDLYYRLAVLEISLPPLRERPGDLPLLVGALLEELGAACDRGAQSLREEAFLTELSRHAWPGNVRELRNYVERCLTLSHPGPPGESGERAASPIIDVEQPLRSARNEWLRYFEQRYVEELLRKHGNNVSAAARAAGVNRGHFYRLLTKAREGH